MLKKSELLERVCDLEMQVTELEDQVWDLKVKSKSKPKKKVNK